MLKIGISSCFTYPDIDRAVFGKKTLSYVENEMFSYVAKAGILPIHIPDLEEDRLHPLLNELDGIVFHGGSDLAPETYKETPIGRWKGDRIRDVYELKVMDYAIKHKIPVFAICRGMQLMNVYFGGDLYQDIFTQKEGVLMHRDAQKYDEIYHEIAFTPNDTLDVLYKGVQSPKVNTIHHQAIKNLGDDLKVLAVSPKDGIVEAIESTIDGGGFALGVQWHPEFSDTLKSTVLDADVLYNYFLEQVKKNKSNENN